MRKDDWARSGFPTSPFNQHSACNTTFQWLLMPFRIEYSPDTEQHLSDLTARQRTIVLDAVDLQLGHEPHVETRNRKPLRPNSIAPWELRIDNLRIYTNSSTNPNQSSPSVPLERKFAIEL